MGTISLQIPQLNSPNSVEDPKIVSDFTTLQTLLNGNLDAGNLAASLISRLSLTLRITGTNTVVAAQERLIADASLVCNLPNPVTAGTVVSVVAGYAATGATPVSVGTTDSSRIYGGGLPFLSSGFLLGAPGASTDLLFDGANWSIVAGEPNTGWADMTLTNATHAADHVQACLKGGRVWTRGTLLGAGSAVTATVPFVAMHPTGVSRLIVVPGNSGSPQTLEVLTSGSIACGVVPGSGTSTFGFDGGSYPVT